MLTTACYIVYVYVNVYLSNINDTEIKYVGAQSGPVPSIEYLTKTRSVTRDLVGKVGEIMDL